MEIPFVANALKSLFDWFNNDLTEASNKGEDIKLTVTGASVIDITTTTATTASTHAATVAATKSSSSWIWPKKTWKQSAANLMVYGLGLGVTSYYYYSNLDDNMKESRAIITAFMGIVGVWWLFRVGLALWAKNKKDVTFSFQVIPLMIFLELFGFAFSVVYGNQCPGFYDVFFVWTHLAIEGTWLIAEGLFAIGVLEYVEVAKVLKKLYVSPDECAKWYDEYLNVVLAIKCLILVYDCVCLVRAVRKSRRQTNQYQNLDPDV